MRIAIAKEIDLGEPRAAATPETVKKFKALGAEVSVERGAGGVGNFQRRLRGRRRHGGDNVGKDADLVLKPGSGPADVALMGQGGA
jgi:NAD/NADP transhydrogenase alpha subunit